MSAENLTCAQCGLGHALLGVRFADGTLIRRVRGDRHRLRILGGAFAFNARFWDAHRREFDEVLIQDVVSGRVWYANPRALSKTVRKTLDPFAGEQVILPLSALEETRTRPLSPGEIAADRESETPAGEVRDAPTQLILLPVPARDDWRPERRSRRRSGEPCPRKT